MWVMPDLAICSEADPPSDDQREYRSAMTALDSWAWYHSRYRASEVPATIASLCNTASPRGHDAQAVIDWLSWKVCPQMTGKFRFEAFSSLRRYAAHRLTLPLTEEPPPWPNYEQPTYGDRPKIVDNPSFPS